MDNVIEVKNVSKKFCKSLKRSMLYGMQDIGRNLCGMSSHPEVIRKNEFWAVDDVSFEVKKGETLGLIGPNGSGKTTMLKMLNGIFWPDKGEISMRGRVGALIAVGAGFHPLLTGRENIYLNAAIMGMNKRQVDKKFDAIVDFADIGDFLDTPVKHYSSGMFVRLGFAVAVHCEPEILLVDEVLAVGDEGFQTKCFNKIGELKKENAAIILVSHNMHTISTWCNHVVLMNKGKYKYFSSVSEGVKAYAKLFMTNTSSIKKISSGNQYIQFINVDFKKEKYNPGDSFEIDMHYESQKLYENIEVDVVVYADRQSGIYFQATNKSYKKRLDLLDGKGVLKLKIKDLKINNDRSVVAVAIWSHKRQEKLFWWEIPIEFDGAYLASGNNYFEVEFKD